MAILSLLTRAFFLLSTSIQGIKRHSRGDDKSDDTLRRRGLVNAKARRNMRLFEDLGYSCTRAAASLGTFDIVAIGPTDICSFNARRGTGREPKSWSG